MSVQPHTSASAQPHTSASAQPHTPQHAQPHTSEFESKGATKKRQAVKPLLGYRYYR